MPQPKFRTSASKRDMRRSHHALRTTNGSTCPNCGEVKHSHRVCEACGHYRGRQVIEPKANQSFENSFDAET